MAYHAYGPVANSIMTVEEVIFSAVASEASAARTGRQRIDVTALVGAGDPNAFVGRKLNIANVSSPAVNAVTISDRRQEWLDRVGAAFRRGMDAERLWWPTQYAEESRRIRANDVLNIEIPNWWRTNAAILAAAIQGRSWGAMEETHIEACVAHFENLLTLEFPATSSLPAARGIIQRWYQVGTFYDFSAHATGQSTYRLPDTNPGQNNIYPAGAARDATKYADRILTFAGYTDTFSASGSGFIRLLTPRVPDYAWILLVGYSGEPPSFDPEHPA